MKAIGFSVGQYFDNDTQRQRWAVIGPGDVWYFARRYGKRAAHALCIRLNKSESKA